MDFSVAEAMDSEKDRIFSMQKNGKKFFIYETEKLNLRRTRNLRKTKRKQKENARKFLEKEGSLSIISIR
jgi:hypothetical protein